MRDQVVLSYGVFRRYAEEKSVLDRALAIEPNDVSTRGALASGAISLESRYRATHQTIDSIRAMNPDALLSVADEWVSWTLAERDVAAAKNALNTIGDMPLTDYSVHLNRLIIEGVIARMTKNDSEARATFGAARSEQEKIVQSEPNYGPALCVPPIPPRPISSRT